MKDGKKPDPNTIHPIPGYDKEIYVKPTLRNPNIIVGDFTYIADADFESHVTHLYEWNGDRLVQLLLEWKWWDKSIEEIDALIPILTCSDLGKVRKTICHNLKKRVQ